MNKDPEIKKQTNEITEGEKEEDDGRIIADMSTVENPSFSLRMLSKLRKEKESENGSDRRADGVSLDRKERRAAIGGTLGAALLIASVYAVAFGLVILVMYLVFKSK